MRKRKNTATKWYPRWTFNLGPPPFRYNTLLSELIWHLLASLRISDPGIVILY